MRAIEITAEAHPTPGARAAVFGAGRTDVDALPGAVDDAGLVLSEWEPSAEDLERILSGARIRLFVWTAGKPLQPVCVDVGEALGK